MRARRDEDADADEAGADTDERHTRHAFPRDEPEDDDPQRDRRDDEGRQTGRCLLFRQRHEPVSAGEEQDSEDERGQKLAPPHPQPRPAAVEPDPAVQDPAREQEPEARGQERRHGLDHHLDGEIGRAPDEVDGRQGRNDERLVPVYLVALPDQAQALEREEVVHPLDRARVRRDQVGEAAGRDAGASAPSSPRMRSTIASTWPAKP